MGGRNKADGKSGNKPTWWEKIGQGQDADWSKDEVLDVLFWVKSIIALALGIAWGVLPLKGYQAVVLYFVTQVVSTVLFYRSVLRVDEADFGGTPDLLFDSLPNAGAVFLLAWIVVYNLVQF